MVTQKNVQASPMQMKQRKHPSRSLNETHSKSIEEEAKAARLVEEGRAFFCSELVAKAYKCAKIMLPTDEACSNFLPVHWTSEKQTIKLIPAARLEKEQLIFSASMFGAGQ